MTGGDAVNEVDDLTRRIADCLEQHLPDMGFDPYRYPSGENKSVTLLPDDKILLSDVNGRAWWVAVAPFVTTTSPGSEIERVLADHVAHPVSPSLAAPVRCACGQWQSTPGVVRASRWAEHRAHVAQALVESHETWRP